VFLSYNRCMRLRWIHVLDGFIAVAIIGLVAYFVWSSNVPHLTAQGGCSRYGQQHTAIITNGAFAPGSMTLAQCDQLKVTNKDNADYELAFGPHENHIEYPGFEETVLKTGESITINAVKAGTFPLHDHIRDKAVLTLTITPL
jgi:hypothetical protein